MGKVPEKLFPRNDQEKEEKKYKLDIRMLDKDAVNECADVPLYHANFKKKMCIKPLRTVRLSVLLVNCLILQISEVLVVFG